MNNNNESDNTEQGCPSDNPSSFSTKLASISAWRENNDEARIKRRAAIIETQISRKGLAYVLAELTDSYRVVLYK